MQLARQSQIGFYPTPLRPAERKEPGCLDLRQLARSLFALDPIAQGFAHKHEQQRKAAAQRGDGCLFGLGFVLWRLGNNALCGLMNLNHAF